MNNINSEGIYIKDKYFIGECLKINLYTENNNNIYNANSTININYLQNIHLVAKDEIIIKRDINLIEFPLFKIDSGLLTLGEENMKGKITIDGNKDNVSATAHLIQMIEGELSIYDNVIICNNLLKISKLSENLFDYGSTALIQLNSKINNMEETFQIIFKKY